MAINFLADVTMGDFAQPGQTAAPFASVKRVQNLLQKLRSGSADGTVVVRQSLVKASGTVTLSSATGTLTTTINGVAIAVAANASDTVSAGLIAEAINASSDALVSGLVTASSAAAVVTIKASRGGKGGNCITLASAAGGGTATASGARLTGGTESNYTYTF